MKQIIKILQYIYPILENHKSVSFLYSNIQKHTNIELINISKICNDEKFKLFLNMCGYKISNHDDKVINIQNKIYYDQLVFYISQYIINKLKNSEYEIIEIREIYEHLKNNKLYYSEVEEIICKETKLINDLREQNITFEIINNDKINAKKEQYNDHLLIAMNFNNDTFSLGFSNAINDSKLTIILDNINKSMLKDILNECESYSFKDNNIQIKLKNNSYFRNFLNIAKNN